MPRYRTLRDFHFPNAAEDIRGAELFGEAVNQGSRDRLGVIADVVFDSDTNKVIYAVVSPKWDRWRPTRSTLPSIGTAPITFCPFKPRAAEIG